MPIAILPLLIIRGCTIQIPQPEVAPAHVDSGQLIDCFIAGGLADGETAAEESQRFIKSPAALINVAQLSQPVGLVISVACLLREGDRFVDTRFGKRGLTFNAVSSGPPH